uniref:Reverse transcriptase-rnase h-integrase n=1 Tax=Moniliophthora roreri TaxID=221103 RepID=A0A0W0FMG7_MONRR
MLGPDTTTEEETRPDKEPKNSSTPTFTPPHLPSKENSEDLTMKKGRSPDSSPSTPEFMAFAKDPRIEMDNMSGEGSSTPKQEQKPRTQEEMMISVATAVLEEVGKKEKKKEKRAKVAAPEPFEGDRKDTKWFLTEVEIFLQMHPNDYNTDKKKCLFLLLYLQGKTTALWKQSKTD